MSATNRTNQSNRRRYSDPHEDRVLLDGDVSDFIAMDFAHEIPDPVEANDLEQVDSHPQPFPSYRLDNGNPVNRQLVKPRQFAFVDVSATDSEVLLDNLESIGDPLEIIYLDPAKDGIAQIADSLADRSDLTSIHLISSGRGGVMHLGNRQLDRADLAIDHASSLARIGSTLAPGGDVLIHGCSLAESDAGQQMIDALARLTGAEVSAWDESAQSLGGGDEWGMVVQRELTRTESLFAFASVPRKLDVPRWTGSAKANLFNEDEIAEQLGGTVTFQNSNCMPWEAGYSPYFALHIPRGICIHGESINMGTLVPTTDGTFAPRCDLVNVGTAAIDHPTGIMHFVEY